MESTPGTSSASAERSDEQQDTEPRTRRITTAVDCGFGVEPIEVPGQGPVKIGCGEPVQVSQMQAWLFGRWTALPTQTICDSCAADLAAARKAALDAEWEREQTERAARLAAQYDAAVPLEYRDATWDDPQIPTGLVDHLRCWDGRRGLFLTSRTPGTGKSSLAALIVKDTLGRYFETVAWANVLRMLELLRRDYGATKRQGQGLLNHLCRADIAVLDDLGAEKPSEWVACRLYEIVSTRYEERRPLIITSNLVLDEIAERLNPVQGEPYGDRIASRLAQMCEQIQVKGNDRRLA